MDILDTIVENKKRELQSCISDSLRFQKVFSKKDASLLAEIKLASPKFDYSKQIDVEDIFQLYGENTQIKAISNLIDEMFFAGDIFRGKNFKQCYNKPIFFKEFVIDTRQIDGAVYFGYDAILLLQRVLSEEQLSEFVHYSNSKNIFPIIEVDTQEGMEKVLQSPLLRKQEAMNWGIAINCRNLATMEIDRKRHFEIYQKFEKHLQNILVFAFSGIDDLEKLKEYQGKFNGVLVGSYFMNTLKK